MAKQKKEVLQKIKWPKKQVDKMNKKRLLAFLGHLPFCVIVFPPKTSTNAFFDFLNFDHVRTPDRPVFRPKDGPKRRSSVARSRGLVELSGVNEERLTSDLMPSKRDLDSIFPACYYLGTALTCSAPPLIVEPKGEDKTTLIRHLPKGLPPEHLKKSRLEIIGHTEIAGNGPGSVLACLFLYFFVFVNNNSHPNTKVMIIKSLNGTAMH